jgi:BirA family transcriptional regulator, biotin operon repressor / biotin---[acetyl-CoA-carboxylase] ligase
MTTHSSTAQSLPDDMAEALSHVAPRLGRLARQVLWYPEISSTSDVAAAMADGGGDEGLVVVADMQTAGRGRLGRTWTSPPGAGIYASCIFRPNPQAARLLTMAAGVAIAEGIGRATGLEVELKWPNDVHCSGRKLAGILAERGREHVVLGFGINVLRAVYPPDLQARATSIELELGRSADRAIVLAECLAALASRYRDLQDGRDADVMTAWRVRGASMIGRRVQWDAAGAVSQGRADRVDDDGALIVRTENGLVRVISGEVRWLP